MFRRSLIFACVFTSLPLAAFAQGKAVMAQPYAFAAPGTVTDGGNTMHVGGGFDVVHQSGVGGGMELGYIGPFPDGFDYGIGLLSFTGSYRWLQHGRVVPFVNGGLSNAVIRGSAGAWHAGGGFEYWMRDGFGLRFELREHVPFERGAHLRGVRIGFTWAPGGRVSS